jgi:hypothetical protein
MAVAVAPWRAFPRLSSAGQNLTLLTGRSKGGGHLDRIYQAMRSVGLKGKLRMSVMITVAALLVLGWLGVLVFEANEQL